jgi:hypothetical protein
LAAPPLSRNDNWRSKPAPLAIGFGVISRRFRYVGDESALPPSIDIVGWTGHVRTSANKGLMHRRNFLKFDHLVSAVGQRKWL